MVDVLSIVLFLLAGLIFGGGAVLWVQKLQGNPLAALLQSAQADNKTLVEKNTTLEKNGARLEAVHQADEEKLKAVRQADQEKIALLAETEQRLKQEFENLSAKIYEDRTEKFKGESKELLKGILDPLNKQIEDFGKKFSSTDKSFTENFGVLQGQIKSLAELNQSIGEQAGNLTDALKGSSKQRGNWGEMVLEKTLEMSGLREGVEYRKQETLNDEGTIKIPDVIVHLPDERDIVIDSKLTLISYEDYCSSEGEVQRATCLKAYLQSVERHIDDLSGKNYQNASGVKTLDYVLMFIPIESAYILAIDEGILKKALRKNIMVVSPATLLIALRTVSGLWQLDSQNKNAQVIAQEAGKMYDKLAGFVQTLETVGKKIDSAGDAYDTAYSQLVQGRGNLVHRAEKLKELGAKTSKSLPNAVLEAADQDISLSHDEGEGKV